MSWESIAQEVADGWGLSYKEAFTLVSFIARKLRNPARTFGNYRTGNRFADGDE